MRIRSLLIIVFSLWAIVRTVACPNSFAIRFYTFSSVTMSIFEVASSKIISLVFWRIARQTQTNYLSPELKFLPFSVISIKRPFGSFCKRDVSPAFCKSNNILSSFNYSSGSKLYLKDPENNVGSWGMIVIHLLRSTNGT